MRKVIVQEFVTLDGLVAGPHNNVDFIPASMQGDQRFGEEQGALMDECDTMLLGRLTYEMFVGYWPSVKDNPEQPFADRFNALSKIIFSNTLSQAPWGQWPAARISNRGPADEVAKLKEQTGKNILISGSISVARCLLESKSVDEYRLILCPIVLGKGRKPFEGVEAMLQFQLDKASALSRGAVLLHYKV